MVVVILMFLDIYCAGTTLPDYLGYWISVVYLAIRVGIPILLIIFGMVDMGKAIVAKKEEDVKKAQSLMVKKLLIGVLVFLLPYLVEFIVKVATRDEGIVNCIKALIDYRTNIFG